MGEVNMEIAYKNYRIVPCDNAPGLFDLREVVIRKKKDSNETYEGFNEYGYGMRFETIIKRIIDMEIAKNEKVFNLSEYIMEYKKITDEFISKLNQLTKIELK